MQAYLETIFNILYLTTVLSIGIQMLKNAHNNNAFKLFGIMAIVLGAGDAFHLIPRSYALFTSGLEANATALGIGKLVTSITMTIFYILLYEFYRVRYQIKGKDRLTKILYLLAFIRIALCLFPQNDWFNYYPSVSWGIYRNIPFAIIGLIILIIFYSETKSTSEKYFKWMWLAITLSFGFYIPVVLWSKTITWVGALMIPKTIAYVWIVFMGYKTSITKSLRLSHAVD